VHNGDFDVRKPRASDEIETINGPAVQGLTTRDLMEPHQKYESL